MTWKAKTFVFPDVSSKRSTTERPESRNQRNKKREKTEIFALMCRKQCSRCIFISQIIEIIERRQVKRMLFPDTFNARAMYVSACECVRARARSRAYIVLNCI